MTNQPRCETCRHFDPNPLPGRIGDCNLTLPPYLRAASESQQTFPTQFCSFHSPKPVEDFDGNPQLQ